MRSLLILIQTAKQSCCEAGYIDVLDLRLLDVNSIVMLLLFLAWFKSFNFN